MRPVLEHGLSHRSSQWDLLVMALILVEPFRGMAFQGLVLMELIQECSSMRAACSKAPVLPHLPASTPCPCVYCQDLVQHWSRGQKLDGCGTVQVDFEDRGPKETTFLYKLPSLWCFVIATKSRLRDTGIVLLAIYSSVLHPHFLLFNTKELPALT